MHAPFLTCPPDIDESQKPGEDVKDLVLRLAQEKASKIAHQYPQHFVIGADQVQWCDGKIHGKPHQRTQAIEQLQRSSGKTTYFYSGLCTMHQAHMITKLVTTEVTFKKLTLQHINRYLDLDQPWHCAGSIRIEGMATCLIEKIASDDPMAIIGMPLMTIASMLESLGFSFLDHQTSEC